MNHIHILPFRRTPMRNPFETEERAAFRDAIIRFVDKELKPFADEWDEAGAFPRELHIKLAELGAFGLGIDEAYGGLGFDDCFNGQRMPRSSVAVGQAVCLPDSTRA